MSQKYEKLKSLLKELFQLDQPDLDFGLYRIMHAKSGEVSQFLDKDLLPQVKEAFGLYKTADKAELEKELAKAIEQAQALGADPETLPKVKDLRAKLANDAVDVGALENEVYDHLFSFFRRYYSEGDFLAKRVYKPGVYAIPYEGEEVKLHWANKDQYYIKTSEYLRDYAFRLRPEDASKPMRVHFRLAEAAEGEHGNVKAAEGKDRVFILAAENFIALQSPRAGEGRGEGNELEIRFEYRPATLTDWPEDARTGKAKPPAQKDLIDIAAKRIQAASDATLAAWITELAKPHITTSGEQADYNRLEAHLRRYTARNTFDYFIHKDLGGFLKRELDFYIKNEVMHLDDVENETAPRVEQYLSKIKVIRKIAGKIIDFLAQLEDFQKKLWLKKKFVVETNYCITLGCIPEEFYPEIVANDAQRDEWVRLFAIDEIKKDMATPGYSVPLTVEFLKAHPTLVLDSRNFDAGFTARILEAIGCIGSQIDGILFQSENSQALGFMHAAFHGHVDCVYIDPPYNTGDDGFHYKDRYQHSSWLTMLQDRAVWCSSLFNTNGLFAVSIDDNEHPTLRLLLEVVFGRDAFVGNAVWKKTSGSNESDFAHVFDNTLLFKSSPEGKIGLVPRSDRQIGLYSNPDVDPRGPWASTDYTCKWSPEERPNLAYAITNPVTGEEVRPKDKAWRFSEEEHLRNVAEGKVWWGGRGELKVPRYKRFLCDVRDGVIPKSLWDDVGTNQHGKQQLQDIGFTEEDFRNPKPVGLISRCISVAYERKPVVLDFFAGSGTTGHAVINLNREDDLQRKFILVEMSDYFETVLLPRIKRVVFSPEWQDSKPKRFATKSEAERSPRIVKVIRLESYEDALNNLETRRTSTQQTLLGTAEAQGADGLKEQYLLRYMLDVETRGSQSLLNVQAFSDPTAYKLKVKRPGSDESREVNVDLLETFNWLIGLTVQHIAAPQRFAAEFEHDAENRLKLQGRLKQDANGPWWFRTVTGTTPDGRKTLVIWRKLTGNPEQDNLVLDEWFTKQGYSTKDYEFQLIYVNGDNNLENLKAPDDTWKVRLIEEDFHRLMFDTEGA